MGLFGYTVGTEEMGFWRSKMDRESQLAIPEMENRGQTGESGAMKKNGGGWQPLSEHSELSGW